MKKLFCLILLASACFVCGNNPPVNETLRRTKKLETALSDMPDIMAEFGRHKITKSDIIKILLEQHPDFEDYSYTELTDAVRKTVDERIYYTIVSEYLTKQGFPPGKNATVKYLENSIKNFPPELRKLKYKNSAVNSLASEPDRQLSVALQSYLKKKKPQEIAVNDDEIEFFYRLNQNIFLHNAQINISFIAVSKNAVNAEKTIKNAHSLLMQGMNFEKLAEKINASLPENLFDSQSFPPEIAAHAAKIPLDEPSEILTFPNYYAIIKVTQKQKPQYIPLKHAAFFIRTELESRKSGIYLEKLLYQLLKKTPVKRNIK